MMRRGNFTGLPRKCEIGFEMLNTVNSSELNRKGWDDAVKAKRQEEVVESDHDLASSSSCANGFPRMTQTWKQN